MADLVEETENAMQLETDKRIHGVAFTDGEGKRIDPERVSSTPLVINFSGFSGPKRWFLEALGNNWTSGKGYSDG